VLREDQEKRTGRRGRRWLWLLAVAPALALVLLLVPLVHPITLGLKDRWVIATAGTGSSPLAVQEGFGGKTFSTTGFEAAPMKTGESPSIWRVQGTVHVKWLRIRQFVYSIIWFRGRRIQ